MNWQRQPECCSVATKAILSPAAPALTTDMSDNFYELHAYYLFLPHYYEHLNLKAQWKQYLIELPLHWNHNNIRERSKQYSRGVQFTSGLVKL